MTQTPNYNLNKFDSADYLEPNSRVGINDSMDIIDTQLKSNADGIDSVATDVTTLETKVDTDVAKINAKDKNQDLDIKLLKASAEGKLYTTDEDDDVAFVKSVNSNALPVAMLTKLNGRTIVGNQLCDVRNKSETTFKGITYSITDGVVTCNGTGTEYNFFEVDSHITSLIVGHKYLLLPLMIGGSVEGTASEDFNKNYFTVSSPYSDVKQPTIYTYTSFSYFFCRIPIRTTVTYNNAQFVFLNVDLTQMFGAGNEPSTVAEVEAIIGTNYIPYNAGSLESAEVSKITSVGFNIFDENVENGRIDVTTGTNVEGTGFRSKNYIPVNPSTNYYCTLIDTNNVWCLFYDANKQTISGWSTGRSTSANASRIENYTFTTPSNCAYIRFYVPNATFSNNVCINVSGSSDGTYKPYFHSEADIPQAIQDLDGYGWSAGNVYNEVDFVNKKYIKRVGSVDLGTLNWSYSPSVGHELFHTSTPFENVKGGSVYADFNAICPTLNKANYNDVYQHTGANLDFNIFTNKYIYVRNDAYTDAQAFKQAMNGVPLYYELATPIETDLSDILTDDFLLEVEGGGTIEFVGNEDYNIPIPSTEVFYLKTV